MHQNLDTKEKEIMQTAKISKALAEWITGNQYKQIIQEMQMIDEIRQSVEDSTTKLVDYVIKHGKNTRSLMTKIHQRVSNSCSFLSDLENLLKIPPP